MTYLSPGEVINKTSQSKTHAPPDLPYAKDKIIVKFKEDVSPAAMTLAHNRVQTVKAKQFNVVNNLHLIQLHPEVSVEKALTGPQRSQRATQSRIISCMPMHRNDPFFSSLWGLQNTGQNGGTPGADIQALDAWNITTGSSNVVVAVIDTGVHYNHQDLSANMWRNTADCNKNGVDDDGNGFIDDCYGINNAIYGDPSDPMDDGDHGTQVAGIIGAVGNNGMGVVGVNWNVSIMPANFSVVMALVMFQGQSIVSSM